MVLISIDGLRPEFYLDKGWNAPNLYEMAHDGTYSKGVASVYPSLTYPAHATMVTGALPARHGVYFNEMFEPGKAKARWYWETSHIKTLTLWDAIHRAGMTSAAISWPVSAGGPIDHCIPEIWSPDKNVDKVTPIREATQPPGFFEEIEQHVTGKMTDNDVDNAYLEMDVNIADIACYTLQRYKPNLLAVHFVCADHFQHTEGREGAMVRNAVANIDQQIKKIRTAIKNAGINDSTAIIITGDHGFCDIHTSLAPNVWLVQNGLVTKKNGQPDWKAWFHASGPFAFLHVKDKGDVESFNKARAAIESLPDSIKKMFSVISREDLDAVGADPDAVLALAPARGYTMNSATDGPATKPVTGGAHGYFPNMREMHTGLIGYGIAFPKGAITRTTGLTDIAPLIATLLHLDLKTPDGVLTVDVRTR